jgi:Arc/MetJ family transcription regulator
MATNLEIDNELIQEVLKLGGHRTKRAVVENVNYSLEKRSQNR